MATALRRGEAPEPAARRANAAATVTVQHAGGRPQLDGGRLQTALAEVDKLLDG